MIEETPQTLMARLVERGRLTQPDSLYGDLKSTWHNDFVTGGCGPYRSEDRAWMRCMVTPGVIVRPEVTRTGWSLCLHHPYAVRSEDGEPVCDCLASHPDVGDLHVVRNSYAYANLHVTFTTPRTPRDTPAGDCYALTWCGLDTPLVNLTAMRCLWAVTKVCKLLWDDKSWSERLFGRPLEYR